MITAIVLVHAAVDQIPETAEAITNLEGVTEVYSCSGDVDLIAIVRVTEHEQLADVVSNHLSKIPGVLDTDTRIGFRFYRRSDVESAFWLGFRA